MAEIPAHSSNHSSLQCMQKPSASLTDAESERVFVGLEAAATPDFGDLQFRIAVLLCDLLGFNGAAGID